MAAHLGERDLKYSTNVDNLVNVVKVSNMIAAPIFDNQGALRGMIHLVNKKLQSEIEPVDIHQVNALLPVLGEILRSSEDSLQVINLAAGLHQHMSSMSASIHDKSQSFLTESPMPMISTGVRYMGDLIKMMVGNKKRAVFEDTSVMQEVMREVKEGAVTFQKELAAKAYEVERERVK